jgi:hypothetical protein
LTVYAAKLLRIIPFFKRLNIVFTILPGSNSDSTGGLEVREGMQGRRSRRRETQAATATIPMILTDPFPVLSTHEYNLGAGAPPPFAALRSVGWIE